MKSQVPATAKTKTAETNASSAPAASRNKVIVRPDLTPLDWLKKNSSTILLVITACVVVFYVVRYRAQAAENRTAGLSASLSVLRNQVPLLLPNELSMRKPELIVTERSQMLDAINAAIDDVLQHADGDNAAALKAQALIARGDASWALANAPALAAAATQPAFRLPRSQKDYLEAAENAYGQVVQSYSSEIIPWTSAQFGIAAIAENRGDWVKAANSYTVVTSNKLVPDSLRMVADRFLAKLPEAQTPALLGPVPAGRPDPNDVLEDLQKAKMATSLPSLIAAPTTEPKAEPTTAPTAAPTTQPAK